MTTIYHPSHPHYAVHKAFVDGSFANPDEPPVVQFLNFTSSWIDDTHPTWIHTAQYRLKPHNITRTITCPEPLKKAPATGTEVWIVQPAYANPLKANWCELRSGDRQLLKNGMVFTTEADAQACYDAYFGEQK